MADLKLGTTLGGAGIWSASNLPLLPSGDRLTYKGWRVYTENDRPTAEDINALSTINGGTVAKNTTFNQSVTVGINLTANTLYSKSYVDITTGGAAPGILFKRSDVTGTPSTEQGIMQITGVNASGVALATMNINARADGGNRIYLNAYKNGTTNTSFVVDSANQQVSVELGSFRVAGSSTFSAVSATTLNVSGAITANTVTPTDWTNHDNRYITGIPRSMQGNSFGAAVVTEKNDVLSVNGNIVDGPYGNNTYSGQVVNFRRTSNTGNALTQIYLDNGVFHIRSGSGSPGAWSWSAGDANGWRKIYDEYNKPTPAEIGALKNTADTMNGTLSVIGDVGLQSAFGRHFKFTYFKNDGTPVDDGYIFKDGPDTANRRTGVRIVASTPNKATGNTQTAEFIFDENGSFVVGERGTIHQNGLSPGVYANSILSPNASGSKQYLRRFRGGAPDVIWHETVQGNVYRLLCGVTDTDEMLSISCDGAMTFRQGYGSSSNLYLDSNGNSVLWFRLNNGAEKGVVWAEADGKLKIRTNHTFSNTWEYYAGMIHSTSAVSGTDRGIIRGTPDGGGWDQWRERSAAVSVDVPGVNTSAYSIWKATSWNNTYVAAMDVHMPNFTPGATRVRLVLQSSVAFYFDGDGSFTTSTGNITAGANGYFNDVYIRSDEKLKSNFTKIENALDKVELLDGLVYDKSNHIGGEPVTREAGLIAQQLQKVLPEAVSVGKDTKENEILTISPTATIALLVNAIKELREEVRELKAQK